MRQPVYLNSGIIIRLIILDSEVPFRLKLTSSLLNLEFSWPQAPRGPGFFLLGYTLRTVFFADGFNIYHALEHNKDYHKFKWLNLKHFAGCFVPQKDDIEEVLYFTAYTPWDPEKRDRHKLYVQAISSVGVTTIEGQFKLKDKKCRKCKKWYKTYEEKQTDVNIASYLFHYAINDNYDKAIIISGDSDLIPAIELVKTNFPEKQIGLIIPITRRAEHLKQSVDFHMKMKEKHLKASLLPDKMILPDGKVIGRPPEWK